MKASAYGMLPQLALIVVRDRAVRQSYKQFLVPRGFVVEEAADGSEALAKAINDPPDIIVTERDLPGLSGDQLCRMLREGRDTWRAPILLLATEALAGDGVREGGAVDAVLMKPCPPEMLFAEMKRVRDRSGDLRARAALARSAARRLVGRSSDMVQAAVRLDRHRSNEPH
jgi:DNA-binding response OmpR family regulator